MQSPQIYTLVGNYMKLFVRILIVSGFTVVVATGILFFTKSFLKEMDPVYNRIAATVRQITENAAAPNVEIIVQRVDGNTVTQRAHLASQCYAISGKDFSDCNEQMYSVQRDGSIKKTGVQYSNEPFVSSSGAYTLQFTRVSTLKPNEESYPGVWKTNVSVVDRESKIVQTFDSKQYGDQFIDITPLVFSEDDKYVFLQAWAMRGGDFIDQMVIIKQAVQDKSFEVIVHNPNPAEAISEPMIKNYTLSLFLGVSVDKKSMFVEEMKTGDSYYHPQLLYEYDFVTGKRKRELLLNTQGGFTLLFSPNQLYFTQQVDNRVTITKVSNGVVISVKLLIPDRCNLNDVSNDGKRIAVTCDQNDKSEAWIYEVGSEKRKLLTSWPTSASGYKLGETYNIFAGFAN